jgi:FMN phosphatase YigB (HAD superfamily)
MPNNEPNWIDRLWENSQDRQAEENLRRLWLEFQADRKPAWVRLGRMVASSEKLAHAARAQIRVALAPISDAELDSLTSDALAEAEKILKDKRWELPAGTERVFLRYLRSRVNQNGPHPWVARVLRKYFENAPQAGEREEALEGDNE